MGHIMKITSIAVFCLCLSSTCAPAAPAKQWNATLRDYGARVSLTVGTGVRKDPQTEPDATFDNDVHTRQVVTGAPYTFTIELPFRVPIDHLAFADSDYATEEAPKEIEIALDNGTILHHTLEIKRPTRRQPAWQEVPVGAEAQTIKVTVLSNYQVSDKVNWGGLAEIAVFTSTDLDEKFKLPDGALSGPTFVHLPPLATAAVPSAIMPPRAKPGEHPCLLLTPQEVTDLRATLPQTERGKATLTALTQVANGSMNGAIEFPDPKGPPGQLHDRGDAVAKQHDLLARTAGTLGMAYTLTGDQKYARRVREILIGYAQRYADYPEHSGANKNDTGKVMGQRLSEAMWLIPLIESYDYIYRSGVLSEADKTQIETQLLRPAITFIWRKDPATQVAERNRANLDWRTAPPTPRDGKPVGNWLNFYNTATMMAGAVMGDQNMLDIAAANFRDLLAHGIGEDGMWNEGAIGYQMFALNAMVPGFETAARQGINLWSFDHSRVKMLFDSPLRYAYPDGTSPGIHDSTRAHLGDWSTMVYDYAYLRYHDPGYAFLTNESPRQLHMSEGVYFPARIYQTLPEPPATTYPSTVFGNLGYAILRQPNLYALMDYGPHGGVHGHYDKLNLILFGAGDGGKGDELGGEPVFHRYEDPLHDEWTKVTVAHNSMTVDEQSQLPCTGNLLLFEDTPDVKIMRAQAAAYPGALLDRTVIVTPDVVIDLYHGTSAFKRVWDRTFRYQDKMEQFPALPANAAPLGQRDGYQHLLVAARQPAEKQWQAAWQTTVGRMNLALAGAPGQQVILCQGPDKEQMALVRQEGEQVNFGAVVSLDAWHNPVENVQFAPTGDPNLVCLSFYQDHLWTQVIVSCKSGSWEIKNGWRSDAQVLYVTMPTESTGMRLSTPRQKFSLMIGGGTFAQFAPTPLPGTNGPHFDFHYPVAGNYYVGSRNGKRATLEWTPQPAP